jgi:hypothetical protein
VNSIDYDLHNTIISTRCYPVLFLPKYSPQHHNLKPNQPTFLLPCKRPGFTPIQNNTGIIVLHILIFKYLGSKLPHYKIFRWRHCTGQSGAISPLYWNCYIVIFSVTWIVKYFNLINNSHTQLSISLRHKPWSSIITETWLIELYTVLALRSM